MNKFMGFLAKMIMSCLRCKEHIRSTDNFCVYCGYRQNYGIWQMVYRIYWYFCKEYKNPIDEYVLKSYYDNIKINNLTIRQNQV